MPHPVITKLKKIILKKQSNLSVSADLTSKSQLFRLIEQVGPHICVLKTHIDILDDFSEEVIEQLQYYREKYQFLIFEDRKFADIGNTVTHQVQNGIYQISKWADIVNAHPLPGEGIIEGLKKGFGDRNDEIGLLLLAEMSSHNNLFSPEYTQATIELARKHSDTVIGFIAMRKLTPDPYLITMTPGVQMQTQHNQDGLGQNYHTPQKILQQNGSDVIIVGRGIYQSHDPKKSAEQYQKEGWKFHTQLHS